MTESPSWEQVAARARALRDSRGWTPHHNPKDLAVSVSIEAAELLECFQWSREDLQRSDRRQDLGAELADVLLYCLYLADAAGLDLLQETDRKLAVNERRFPVPPKP